MNLKQFPAGPRAAAARLTSRLKRAGLVALYSGEVRRYVAGRIKRAGQVTVELLLVLPVFMLLLFFIMEMGNIGFQTILAHHCAYELARIGSLVAGENGGQYGGGLSVAQSKMESVLGKMFPSSPGVRVEGKLKSTLKDPQSEQTGNDLEVTLYYPAKLIFPGSSQVLADAPKGARIMKMTIKVRMPVETPFRQ